MKSTDRSTGQNRAQEQSPRKYGQPAWQKGKGGATERTVFSPDSEEQPDIHMQNKTDRTHFTKWTTDLNKDETVKLLEANESKDLDARGYGSDFFKRPQAWSTESSGKLDFIKIKNCSVKGHVGRTRQDCKKTFKKDIWKRLSKLYEEFLKLKKKETVWLKNGPPHLPLADASPNKTLDGE